MSNWINFAEIRQKVSLEDVLFRFYRLTNLKRDGDKVVGACPIHNGDSARAFHADLGKNVWHCFSQCKKGGNQIDFVAAKEGISIRDAALKLQAFFLAGTPPASPGTTPPAAPAATPGNGKEQPRAPKHEESEDDENPVLGVKLDLKPDHPHLIEDRKLQLATAQHFGIGYCSRGIMRGCIAIPVHDEEGELVAYAGRRLKPSDIREFGKYKFPKGFKKERVLFNLNRAKEHLAEGIVLVEGFFSALKLYEAGFHNVVAAMGSDLSPYQARLLADSAEVIVLFDGNEAGRIGTDAALERLAPLVPIVRLVKLADGLEPDDLPPKALRWLLNGLKALDLAEVAYTPRPRSNGHAT